MSNMNQLRHQLTPNQVKFPIEVSHFSDVLVRVQMKSRIVSTSVFLVLSRPKKKRFLSLPKQVSLLCHEWRHAFEQVPVTKQLY